MSVVNAGSTIARGSFSALRINASGLAVRAVFRVNGVQVLDDRAAPFEVPNASLVTGSNEVAVTTYAANGMQGQLSLAVRVQ